MKCINYLREVNAIKSTLFLAIGSMPKNVQKMLFGVHNSYIDNGNQSMISYFKYRFRVYFVFLKKLRLPKILL